MAAQDVSIFTTWIPLIGSLIGSVIAVGTLITRKISGIEERHVKELLESTKEIHAIDKRLTIIETYNDVFWKDYKKEAAKVITQPHTPEIDEYMRLMQERDRRGEDLTRSEKEHLVMLLEDTIDRNYEVAAYTDRELGVYAALLSRFRTELKMEEKLKEIDQRYDEQRADLERRYEEKRQKQIKKRRFPWLL